jgi:hypothetical protein
VHPILADRRRFVLYLAAWIPLAGILVLILTQQGTFNWTEASLFAFPVDFVYAFVCLGSFYLTRAASIDAAGPWRIIVPHVGAGLVSAGLWLALARAWLNFLETNGLVREVDAGFTRVQPVFFGRAFLIFAIASLLHYLLIAFEDSRRAETQALEFQILSREAELKTLRAQLHPHFLFNSLNSVVSLIKSDPEGARKTCVMLADFLRSTLSLGSRDRITLGDEVALAESLLSIEKVRFGERLRFAAEVGEAARVCQVPPLLLQPLVENAVTHGISNLLDGGCVRLVAARRGDRLEITVENPRDPEAAGRRGTGLGIDNVRRRLRAVYGEDAALDARALPDSFRVDVALPAETA